MADYRYPGLRPFEDTDLDRSLFFGRDREKEELLHLILAEKLTVVFAKSGTGKSSLLNAGILQALRERDFLPIKIRFNDSRFTPLETIYQAIADTATRQQFDAPTAERDTLARYFQAAEFWSARDTLLTPALIFDQFEEFFETYDSTARREFIAQFAECVKAKQIGLKVVIALREDYLAQLEELAPEMPEIFSHRFRLTALRRPQAQAAIECPARSQDGAAPAFCYAPETLAAMLDFLGKRKERDTIVQTDEIEPFQLQLLCQDIETKIRQQQKSVVQMEDLGGESGMQQTLENFYDDRINHLETEWERRQIRLLCETALISITGQRLSLEEGEIKRRFSIIKSLLDNLVNARLLRADARVGSIYYELSSDTLIEPIQHSQKRRESEKMIRSSRWFNIALNSMLEGEPEQIVIEHYQKAIQFDPDNALAHNNLGLILSKQAKYAEAMTHYQNAIRIDPNFALAYNGLGVALYKQGQYTEAIKNYRKAIQFDPNLAYPWNNLGWLFLEQGEYDNALESLKKAIQLAPNYALAHSKLGTVFYYQGKNEEALQECQKAVQLDPKLAIAYNFLGLILGQQGKYEEAIKNHNKAIELAADFAYPYNGIGLTLAYQGHYKSAIEYCQEAIKIDPKFIFAYVNMGNALRSLGRDDEAFVYYQKAMEIAPTNHFVNTSLGHLFLDQGQYDDAINAYQKAIACMPNYATAYNGLGLVLKEQNKYDDSIKNHLRAIELAPNFAYPYSGFGWTLLKIGKYKEAFEKFQTAVRIDANFAFAYIGLCEVYSGYEHDDVKAYEMCEKAYRLNNGHIQIKTAFAAANLIIGHFEKAFNLATEILNEPNLALSHKLNARLILLTTLLLQEKQLESCNELKEFIKDYKLLPEDYKKTWKMKGAKDFINKTQNLSDADKTLLLNLIDMLEAPKAEGDKKLQELKARLPELLPQ